MLKKTLTLIVLSFAFSIGFAQIFNPTKWSTQVKTINESEIELEFTAKLEKGWHLYSQFLPSADGPIATEFKFGTSKLFLLSGKVKENSKVVKEYDPNFEMELNFFKDKAIFCQKIIRKTNDAFKVSATVYFMVCDETKCLPPEELEFEFSIPASASNATLETTTSALPTETNNTDSAAAEEPVEVVAKTEKVSENAAIANTKKEDDKSLLGIFIAGFLGGLLALLTPCVFPMIPLTVSFFTKQSKTRAKGIINALIYGISIILIYVGLGFSITKILGPDALNEMASNVWVNLAFFIIFMVFAMSFLGAFEITLPSSWVNKADEKSEKGGLIGIFFMAFTLSLVSFSCTGPIIGTLLVEAAVNGGSVGPITGMAGFSFALALPFGLFAAFPGWLNSLPKSGGWLNSVKVVLGLLELALALKFFSNVDLAYHWGILTREIFIALWIIIFAVLGFYLLGKIKFSHDSDVPYVSIPRLLLAILSFSFVVYLIPGMWGAPLKLISGFPPPMFYTEGWSLSTGTSSSVSTTSTDTIDGIDKSHCPHNLPCFHDYDKAKAYAKQVGKPIMVDFTGWSCVNCRKMEDKVWIDPRVMSKLANDYVLVSLYVDDKTELKENEKYVSKTTGKKVKTVGNKWSDFQTARFKTNSQPWYVLLDHNEQELNQPVGYDPNIDLYLNFLDEGLKEFKNRNANHQ